jgi:DNA-binding transcriptional LysR family regulator
LTFTKTAPTREFQTMKQESKKFKERIKSSAAATQIRRIDLNLFRVFDTVMQHRSVTKAAQMLSVTPSAVSHALSRLRQTIGDELFIPYGSGVEPTPRALELASEVREGLQSFQLALMTKPFLPKEAVRTFRIAASDQTSVVILPALVRRLAKSAPNVDLRVFPLNRLDAVRQLGSNQVDLLIGWFGRLPDGIRRSKLYQEQESIVVRAGHPLTQSKVTKERLFEFPHVVVELTGTEENERDGFMDEAGVVRRVWIERALLEFQDENVSLVGRAAVCVPYFAAVVPLLQVTDMVATLPRRLALSLVAQSSIVLLDLPYPPIAVDVEMVWHQRANQDDGFDWLRNELVSSVADLA